MRRIPAERVVLDGEIVAFDETGRPNFQRLGRRIHLASPRDVALARAAVPVVFVVFDALAVGDTSLLAAPLGERQAVVESLVPGEGAIRRQPVLDDGEALLALCEEHGLEGVVAKKRGSKYTPGPTRTGDWIKIKCERDAELVVIGWTDGEGARKRLGALDVGSYDAGILRVRGRVGSGLDEEVIDWILPRLEKLRVEGPVAQGKYDPRKVHHHVRPEIVVSVRYLGWSQDGSLRFPVFRGVRDDVAPSDCTASPREARRAGVAGSMKA
jgi:bifunctional non-homologous end joining protein LigD